MEHIKNTAISNKHHQCGVFVPGDILKDFNADFLDDDYCQSWAMGKLHQDRLYCPECGDNVPERLMRSFWDCKRITCDRCGKYFTALTGTFLSGCHFSFREIVLLAFLLALGVPDKQIAKILKVSAESVRLWRLKFEAMEKICSSK